MAGKIIADQIEHSTAGSLDTSYVVNGSVKAWARFNGTGTAAIDDSFNIASLNDNGTGNYTVNYTNSMSNDNYAKADGGGHWSEQSTSDATNAAAIITYSSSASLADYTNVTFMVAGDLA